MKKTKSYFKQKEIIVLGITSLLFIILSTLIITNQASHFDSIIHSYIINIRNNSLTSILTIITNFAGASFLLATSIILIILMKNKKIPGYIFINLSCAFLTNEIAKNIFNRSRPIGINLIEETGLSYPSGHSMVGLAFYGFIIYLINKFIKNKTIKIYTIISLIVLILIIGFSRIYLGVHYLTDVLGGFLLGFIYLNLFIKCIKLEKK